LTHAYNKSDTATNKGIAKKLKTKSKSEKKYRFYALQRCETQICRIVLTSQLNVTDPNRETNTTSNTAEVKKKVLNQ